MSRCLDGPLAGEEMPITTAAWILFPFVESCASPSCLYLHIGQHKYAHDGRWVCSWTDLGLGED